MEWERRSNKKKKKKQVKTLIFSSSAKSKTSEKSWGYQKERRVFFWSVENIEEGLVSRQENEDEDEGYLDRLA